MNNRKDSKEIRIQNKIIIAKYVFEKGRVSRQEISTALGYSMPTVFQNITDLINYGLLCESGEFGSRGGRKAKVLTINKGFRFSVGVDITRNHIRLILMDVCGDLLAHDYIECVFEDSHEYYWKLSHIVNEFIENSCQEINKIIGVGISIPGIIDQEQMLLLKSHALKVQNVSLENFKIGIQYKVHFDNDANNAAYAEIVNRNRNTVYLSLNDTVGGAIYYNGEIYQGDNYKSAEFGHMIIEPNGKLCYCGKRGCIDAYCAAIVLSENKKNGLETYFSNLESNPIENGKKWSEYLEYLAIAVTNLRMAYDCDIIVGGNVGGYLEHYQKELGLVLSKYNNMDTDTTYLHLGKYKWQSSAMGAAMRMIEQFILDLD